MGKVEKIIHLSVILCYIRVRLNCLLDRCEDAGQNTYTVLDVAVSNACGLFMVNLALLQTSSEITRLNCRPWLYTISEDLFIKVSFMSNGVMSLTIN